LSEAPSYTLPCFLDQPLIEPRSDVCRHVQEPPVKVSMRSWLSFPHSKRSAFGLEEVLRWKPKDGLCLAELDSFRISEGEEVSLGEPTYFDRDIVALF